MENFIPINFHQTRDFSQKMSATFEFVRQNFKPLGKSILVIAGPPVLVVSLLMGSFFGDFFTASFNAGTNPELFENLFLSTNFWLQLALMFVFLIVSTVATVASINNYIILYEEKPSNKIEVSEVWDRVRSTFWMYLGTGIALTILLVIAYTLMILLMGLLAALSPFLIFFGALGAICGFIYLVVGTSLVFVIRAYERIGFFDALTRSFKLIQGKWWSTFGLIFVLYMIAVVVSYIFVIPGYVIAGITALHQANPEEFEKPASSLQTIMLVFFTLYYLAQLVLYTLPNVGIAFQYFNLVERKEARGLMNQIQSIGEPPPAPSGQDEHY